MSKEIPLTEKELEARQKAKKSIKKKVKEIGRALDFMGFPIQTDAHDYQKSDLYRRSRARRGK